MKGLVLFTLSLYIAENIDKFSTLASKCGKTAKCDDEVFTDGETDIYRFPWLTKVEYKNSQNISIYSCNAILINSRCAISTAYCFTVEDYKPLNLVLRKYNSDLIVNSKNNSNIIIMPIEKVILHPKYDSLSYQNDISLIRMVDNILFSDFIRPICLSSSNVEAELSLSLKLIVASWYIKCDTVLSLSRSNFEFQIVKPFIDHPICNGMYKNTSIIIRSEHLCANREIDKSSHSRDASAPLMKFENDQFKLIGILLYGSNIPDVPDVYLNLYFYIDWIESNLLM